MKRLIAAVLCASLLLYACASERQPTSDPDAQKDSSVLQQDKAMVLQNSYLEQFGRKYIHQDSMLEQWMDASLRRIWHTALVNAKKMLRYVPVPHLHGL